MNGHWQNSFQGNCRDTLFLLTYPLSVIVFCKGAVYPIDDVQGSICSAITDWVADLAHSFAVLLVSDPYPSNNI